MANKQMLKGQWNEIKGRVRNAWGELTDDDMAKIEGDWEQLVGTIQKRTGQVQEDVERGLTSLLERIREETRGIAPDADPDKSRSRV